MRKCCSRPDAVARIKGGREAPGLLGEVRFYQEHGHVLVVANIANLPQNGGNSFFALHIHNGGSCAGKGFPETGGHYDPADVLHPSHAGDLPPLLRCSGGAYLVVRTDRFRVQDVIGRTVVIHSGSDDFQTQPAGNAGVKIACGTICRVCTQACGRRYRMT